MAAALSGDADAGHVGDCRLPEADGDSCLRLLMASACRLGGPRLRLGLSKVHGISNAAQARHGGPDSSHCFSQLLDDISCDKPVKARIFQYLLGLYECYMSRKPCATCSPSISACLLRYQASAAFGRACRCKLVRSLAGSDRKDKAEPGKQDHDDPETAADADAAAGSRRHCSHWH